MLKVILWKHSIVRFNTLSSCILTLCELLIPIVAFLLTISAESQFRDLGKVYINESNYIGPVSKDEILTRLNVGSTKILYAPDTKFTEDLVREVQLKLSLYNEDIKRFESKQHLIEYYNNYEKAGTTVALLFGDVGHKIPKHLNYEIMIHDYRVMWDTNKLFSDTFVYTPGMGSELYMDKTFGAVQVALEISFIELASNKSFDTNLELQEFPYPPHMNTDHITTTFRSILPCITIIGFIFICPVTLKRICLEKELQKISGCKSLTMWFGWYLNGILINAVSAFCIAFMLTQNLFGSAFPVIEHCNVIILGLFLILYCSATVTFFFAFSTYFTKASLAMVLGILLWISSYSIFVAVAGSADVLNASIKAIFCLFPPIALHYGFYAISLFELREKDLTAYNLFESPTSSYDDLFIGQVMVMLIVNTILYFVLAVYLDKLWPGISKPWYFLLDKALNMLSLKKVAPTSSGDNTSYSLLGDYDGSTQKPLLQLKNVNFYAFTATGNTVERNGFQRRAHIIQQQFKERWLFFKKNWIHYVFPMLLFVVIVLLTFVLGQSGYHDVSKDGTRFPMVLNKYGATDVYYSISGTDAKNKFEHYYENIIKSANGATTKVMNVSDTIIEKGLENIAHYIKRMIIAAEFAFDDNGHLREVKLLHSNKALHGSPIGINAAMNAILKYTLGDEYSISVVNTPLHPNNQKQQGLTQSEFSNLFLWIILLPIGPVLLVSTGLLFPTIEYMKNTRRLEKSYVVTSVEYWFANFLWDAMFYVLAIFILYLVFFIPLHSMDWVALHYLCSILLAYGFLCIPFAYFFTYSRAVESAYAKFLIVQIIFAPIIAGVLLAFEEIDSFKESVDSWKFFVFVLDPQVALCYVLGRFQKWADQRAYIEDTRFHWSLWTFFAYMILLVFLELVSEWLPTILLKIFCFFRGIKKNCPLNGVDV